MALQHDQIQRFAQALWTAEQTGLPVAPLSDQYPALTETDAYRISAAKLQLRNRQTTGYKLGYTSEAMRRQMNISTPNFGVLTDDMRVCGTKVIYNTLIHPLIEPEIAVQLQNDLPLADHYDADLIMTTRPRFMLALEICDTRYHTYEFSAVDNIADNSSAARYALGEPFPITRYEQLEALSVELWIDGKMKDQGVGANALGNPLLAVAWLGNRLRRENRKLQAGDLILTGGLTKGYLVQAGQVVLVKSSSLDSKTSIQFS